MSLHAATRPIDHRWHLELTSERRARTLTAVDDYGQRWTSTRFRRYGTQNWDCGHIGAQLVSSRVDYRGQTVENRSTHYSHARYWSRTSSRRGVSSPVYLCEMTATLSPLSGLADTRPASMEQAA